MFCLEGTSTHFIMKEKYIYYFPGYILKYHVGIKNTRFQKNSGDYRKFVPYFVAPQTFI